MKNVRKRLGLAVMLAWQLLTGPAQATGLADTAQEVKQATVEAARKTGQAVKKAAQATGKAASAAATEVAASARTVYAKGKTVTKKVVADGADQTKEVADKVKSAVKD